MAVQCRTALKEWASVLRAMERGEQVVLIRKGGLLDSSSGFELLTSSFLFYPTFEHQTAAFLRSPFGDYFEDAARQRPHGQTVRFTLFGRAVHTACCQDPGLMRQLEPFHIYNEAFLEQRLRWQPTQPLVVVIVRAFRLSPAVEVPRLSRYAGCRSWVELEQAVGVERAVPVLDDGEFHRSVGEIRRILASDRAAGR